MPDALHASMRRLLITAAIGLAALYAAHVVDAVSVTPPADLPSSCGGGWSGVGVRTCAFKCRKGDTIYVNARETTNPLIPRVGIGGSIEAYCGGSTAACAWSRGLPGLTGGSDRMGCTNSAVAVQDGIGQVHLVIQETSDGYYEGGAL